MLGNETFRLRTPFGDFLVRIDRFAGPPGPEQRELARRALAELRFGLEVRDPSIVRTAQQIASALDGGGSFGLFRLRELGPSLGDANFESQLLRRLEEEFDRGRLVVEREQFASLTERPQLDIELPPLGPPPRQPAPESTFIAIRLVDQLGAPVVGRPLRIELPDGSSHERSMDPDGFGRVAGFTKDGLAKVIFLDVHELDFKTKNPLDRIVIPIGDEQESDQERLDDVREALNKPPEERADEHFVELVLLDQDDVPIVNELVVVVDASGQEFLAVSDDVGNVRVDGLIAGAVKIELRNRNGDEWRLDEQ